VVHQDVPQAGAAQITEQALSATSTSPGPNPSSDSVHQDAATQCRWKEPEEFFLWEGLFIEEMIQRGWIEKSTSPQILSKDSPPHFWEQFDLRSLNFFTNCNEGSQAQESQAPSTDSLPVFATLPADPSSPHWPSVSSISTTGPWVSSQGYTEQNLANSQPLHQDQGEGIVESYYYPSQGPFFGGGRSTLSLRSQNPCQIWKNFPFQIPLIQWHGSW
jgi:hypothetical protein